MAKSGLLKTAGEMDALLSEVILLQRDYVEKLCPSCENPCCKRVRYLFDEKDLIFARVSAQESVPKKKHKGKKGCPFLSATGCLLPPKARPFTCHRYLCDKLKKEMAKQEPDLVNRLTEKIRTLEMLRVELWKEYLKVQARPGRNLLVHVGGLRERR
ncbi:MAG: hypothetical protein SWE60_15985 [Thermodesulfobacteriota bacterium]|nr:hypothetical protein [Thermodesulfobacteriota bacterium]